MVGCLLSLKGILLRKSMSHNPNPSIKLPITCRYCKVVEFLEVEMTEQMKQKTNNAIRKWADEHKCP